ncbi:unnamed protein product [Laminaria digitata]
MGFTGGGGDSHPSSPRGSGDGGGSSQGSSSAGGGSSRGGSSSSGRCDGLSGGPKGLMELSLLLAKLLRSWLRRHSKILSQVLSVRSPRRRTGTD